MAERPASGAAVSDGGVCHTESRENGDRKRKPESGKRPMNERILQHGGPRRRCPALRSQPS
jgi:hypothetical protein